MAPRTTSSRGLTVAVTGPTGEIGQAVVAALERSREVQRVLGMARRPFDPSEHGWKKVFYRRGDVLDREAVDALVSGADVVVHLAFIIMGGAGGEPRGQPRRLAQRVRGGGRGGRQAPGLRLLGRRLRLPQRQPAAAHRGRAGARHRQPLLLGAEGRGRGAAERDAGGQLDRRLRVSPVHRRRAAARRC